MLLVQLDVFQQLFYAQLLHFNWGDRVYRYKVQDYLDQLLEVIVPVDSQAADCHYERVQDYCYLKDGQPVLIDLFWEQPIQIIRHQIQHWEQDMVIHF